MGAQLAGVGALRRFEGGKPSTAPGAQPAVDRLAGVAPLGPVGVGVGPPGDGAHDHAAFGGRQPFRRRLGDHPEAVQGYPFAFLSFHVSPSVIGTGGMKRRLPSWRKGETVLAASSSPPETEEAKRQRPSAAHPGMAAAAAKAARIAATVRLIASPAALTTSPPSSTASAAKVTAITGARLRKRRSQPRAVVCGTPAASAAGRAPPAPPAAASIAAPIISTLSRRRARRNDGKTAWVDAHGRQLARRTKTLRQRPSSRT